MKAPVWFRIIRLLIRGTRPLRSIATDLHVITTLYREKMRQEGIVLPEDRKHTFGTDDLLMVSYDVKEPEIDPQTGKPVDLGELYG